MSEDHGALPLAGIKVVELGGGLAAGLCTHLLAGYGADVVQVGDPGLSEDEEAYLSRGKRRIAADSDLSELFGAADVVIDGRPRHTPVSPAAEDIWSADPHLVVVAITPFGLAGPHHRHKVTNIVAFANGGIMALTGEREREPLQTGGDQAFLLAGLHAFAATSTALLVGSLLQGEGELIDLSMQECAASMLEYCASAWEYESLFVERSGNTPRAEWGVYQTLDGWAGVCALGRQIPALLDTLGLPHEERFLDPVIRVTDARDELMAHVMVFMMERTKAELVALGPPNKLPLGAVRTAADLVDHPPLVARGFFDGDAGGRLPGRPFPGFGWAPLGPVTAASAEEALAAWSRLGTAAGVAS